MFNAVEFLENHIHGDKFAEMCKFYINDKGRRHLDGIEKENAIVFCRTDDLPELFNIIRNNGRKYILISHNSDHNINEERYSWKPDNVVKWFAQNVIIEREDLHPIPIGNERPIVGGCSGNIQDFVDVPFHRAQNLNKIAYANWSDGTNITRKPLKDYLKTQEWCTVQEERIPFKKFLSEVRNHDFIISPPGNGWDVHRTWESLYSGSIPVCKNSKTNKEFERILPIVLYEDFQEITYEFLDEKKKEIVNKLKNNEYTLQALTFTWWRNLIEHYGKSYHEIKKIY